MMRQDGDEYAKRIIKWVKNDEGDAGILAIMNDMTREIMAGVEVNSVTLPVVTACMMSIAENHVELMKSEYNGSLALYESLRTSISTIMTTIKVKGKVDMDE